MGASFPVQSDMQDNQVVSALVTQALLRAAKKSGLDTKELLREADLDPTRIDDPNELVAASKEDVLWRLAGSRADDPTFGLRVARALSRGAFRGLEFAIRSSANVSEGLQLLARFGRLFHGNRYYSLRTDPEGGATLVYEPIGTESPDSILADFALAAVVQILRDATGVEWSPTAVRLRHRGKGDQATYRRMFKAGVEFDQPENAIDLDAAVLATPMKSPDPTLCAVLERYLRAELESVDPARSLEDAVRGAIARALPEQESDLEAVAVQVGLSSRVLQKRLQQAGTSFQEQLDTVREQVAKRYLMQPSISLAGLALLLGYSDVTAFHRAFKRWTGITPGDFRKRALAER